jgi:hypothetical protein
MSGVIGALDADTVEKLVIGLVVVLVLGGIIVLRSAVKIYTKVAIILVLGGLGVALLQNRTELGICSQTCHCAIYGHDVDVPHLPFSCDY